MFETFVVINKNETFSIVGTLMCHVFTARDLQADVKVLKILFYVNIKYATLIILLWYLFIEQRANFDVPAQYNDTVLCTSVDMSEK